MKAITCILSIVLSFNSLSSVYASSVHIQSGSRQFSKIPNRLSQAPSGRAFMSELAQLDPGARENAIVNEILNGNIPKFMRNLVPVTVRSQDRNSNIHAMTFWVMPDYLAVGSDQDYVRVPMNLYSAERIAEVFNYRLPTRKMVDAIYKQAQIKLRPRPMRPGPQMTSTNYYFQHDSMIQKELANYRKQVGTLVAGHKKDVVQTRRLIRKPSAIAIYGWHGLNGNPIQPLSTVHGAEYADYSHGIRMVANQVQIEYKNGTRKDLSLDEVLKDRKTSRWLSDEGPIQFDQKRLRLASKRHSS